MSDFHTQNSSGQQYLAQWGQESRELLFDNAKFVFASSCLDHCGSSLLTGDAGPLIGGHSSLDVLNDWFFGHNLLPHKLIEGMSPGGVDQQPNSALPFNPTCRNLVDGSLIGGGDDDEGVAADCSDACAAKFVQCFDQVAERNVGWPARRSFDQCRRRMDGQHNFFAESCEAGCVVTDTMLSVLA